MKPPLNRLEQTLFAVAVSIACLASAFEAYGTLTAMPVAAEQFGSIESYAWTMTSMISAQLVAIVVAGRISDKIGSIRPLAVGVVLFVIGLFTAGLAPTMATLILARVLQGLGSGAMNLTVMVAIASAYKGKARADMMGLLSFCWLLPAFVGPPIAAWITETFSWHWVFLGVIGFVLPAIALGLKPAVKLDSPPKTNTLTSPIPISFALLATLGVCSLQLAGTKEIGEAIGSLSALIGVGGFVVLMIALPKLMPAGFRRLKPGLPSIVATRILTCGALFASENFLVLLLTIRYEMSLTQAGILLSIGSLGWTVGAFAQGRDWISLRKDQLIKLGTVLMVISTAGIAFSAWAGFGLWVISGCYVVSGLGAGLMSSVSSVLNMQLSEEGELGRNTSSIQLADTIGNAVFTGMAGTIFAALHLISPPAVVFAAIYASLCVVSVLAACVSSRIGKIETIGG